MALLDRFKRVWNAFREDPVTVESDLRYGASSTFGSSSPSRTPIRINNERSIVASIYTRLGIDVSGIPIKHVLLDDQKRYKEDADSAFNDCLTLEPNIDQAPRAFRQDIVNSLFDWGVAVIVPVDASVNPETNGLLDIYSMRVGQVLQWYPNHVRLNVYNEKKAIREEIIIKKSAVAIVENPLYSVMNEHNSTLQRLIRKLGLLDAVDEQSGSGKLDIIIQLPYVIKSEALRTRAEQRREDIEFQLRDSKYGIAYTDGTEKITQLNRPAENNLLKQVEFLTNMLYSQLGLTEAVMNGTADEAAMTNYFARTIKPILDAIVEAMRRSFLGKQGLRRNENVMYFRDPFEFASLEDIADLADTLVRNEVATGNELRQAMGMPPHPDPKADKLQNSNMPQPEGISPSPVLERNRQNGS